MNKNSLKSYLISCLFVGFTLISFAQSDSIRIDCEKFERDFDNVLHASNIEYAGVEEMVFETILGAAIETRNLNELFTAILTSEQTFFEPDEEKYWQQYRRLKSRTTKKNFNSFFTYENHEKYESGFALSFSFWQTVWEYSVEHEIEPRSMVDLWERISRYNEGFDINSSCNKKVAIVFLGRILTQTDRVEKRFDFYDKSKSLALDFYKSAGLTFEEVESTVITYLNDLGFDDSTLQNQIYTFSYLTSDLAFYPLPLDAKLRGKFEAYHKKLFSQADFTIDQSRIVKRPSNLDSLMLLKDIMRAYPDSIMFAPGKTKLELQLESLINKENAEDAWFLSIYAGAFNYHFGSMQENFMLYTPHDYSSEGFRAWYYLYLIQKMYNLDRIEPGVERADNFFPSKSEDFLNYYFIEVDSFVKIVTQEGYRSEDFYFNESSFYLELFSNPLFQEGYEPYVFQLKIDTNGKVIPTEMIAYPELSAAQHKLVTDALSKYAFRPFKNRNAHFSETRWFQLRCKRKTEEEEAEENKRKEYDWFEDDLDLSMELVEEMPMDIPPPETTENYIFDFMEVNPSFPGGDDKLDNYLKRKVKSIKVASEYQKNGIVYIRFVVEKNGEISNVKVLRGINETLDQHAVEIVKNMPNWIPGKNEGEVVRCRWTIPVEIEF